MTIILVFSGGFALTEFTIEESFATSDSQANLAVGIIGKDIDDETSVGAIYIFDDADGNDYYSLTKIMVNPHELSHGQFGQFIAYHDDDLKLAVAAPWKYDEDRNPIGAIYILDGTTGDLLSIISNPNPYDNRVDEFGISVAFVGDGKIAVGSPVQPANSQFAGGMVYLFDTNTGDLIRSITDSNPREMDTFGHSVASLEDGKIAVGIPGKDVNGIDFAGAVSIFDANTGSLVKTIKNPEPDDHDEFGKFIVSDIDNNRLLVGAHHRNVDGKTSAGSVYLFDADTGSLALAIPNPDPDNDVYFGKSVLLAGDKIVVGAPGNGTFEQGSVYIFDADSGKLLETIDNPQRIRPSEFGYTNEFGLSLAFDKSNDRLVIGDPGKIVDETLNTGGVYIYDFNGDLIQLIDNPDPVRNDSFGHFVTFVGTMESSSDDDLFDNTATDKHNPDLNESSAFASSEERPDAFSEWDKTSTFTTTGTAVARVVDHYMNMDSTKIETLTVDIYTERNEDNPELKVALTETDTNTGIFEGEIFFSETKKSLGNTLQVNDGDVVSVEYMYSQVPGSDKLEDMMGVGQEKTIQNSQGELEIINEETGADKNPNFARDTSNSSNGEKIRWLESSYPTTGTGVVRITDPDMNLDSKAVDNFDVDVWSDSDLAGIDLTVTETDSDTGIFEGTIFFSTNDESSGHRLRVAEGETISVKYEYSALPDLHTSTDDLDMISTASIQGIYNPDNADKRITLDKTNYTWTDRVYITIDAPEHNLNSNKIEEIGNSEQYPVKVATRHFDLDNYRLVETGIDTGIFAGEVTLTGFSHDADGNANTGIDGNDVVDIFPSGDGPIDGLLPADNEDGITVSFEHAEDETAISSASIIWNEGKVQWLEDIYPATGTSVVRVIDPDMNLDPEEFDNFQIDVWSDSDAGGIDLTVTETGNATGIFEGTVFFSTEEESSGHTLRVYGERHNNCRI